MKVYILPEAHAEIMHYVHKSNIEISGLGRVVKDSEGNLCVTKVYLLKQENTAASTDICEEAMSNLLYETREDKGDLNFWWHSHVNMATFWSGTDMATIKQFGSKGYLLSTVFNKKGEHRTSYFQGSNGFLPELFVDDIKTHFAYIPTQEQVKFWDAEYTTKCAPKVWSGYDYSKWSKTAASKHSASNNTPKTKSWKNKASDVNFGHDYLWDEDRWDKDWEERFMGTHDANVPLNFKDKNYYTTEPVGQTSSVKNTDGMVEIVGSNTRSTVDEILEIMREIFDRPVTPSFDELDVHTALIIYDAFDITYYEDAIDADDVKIERFYNTTMASLANFNEVEYEMRENQFKPEDQVPEYLKAGETV